MKNDLQIFDILKAEITTLAGPIMQCVVTSETESETAMLTVKQIKKLENAVEKRRKELVDPLNAQVKQINAYVKAMMEPLDIADGHVRQQLIGWEKKLEQERRAAQAKLDAEKRARDEEERKAEAARKQEESLVDSMFGGGDEEDTWAEEQRKAEEGRKKFIAQQELDAAQRRIAETRVKGTQKVWTFNLIDAAQVPREFLVVDERKIREAVKAGARDIPGVSIFEETKISVRS
jgi:septal ring factor EnvC (AmiA/AmiB activator)